MDALTFTKKAKSAPRQPIYVLIGEDGFLKGLCKDTIRKKVLGESDWEFGLTTYAGDKLEWSAVRNDLDTLPFLSPARLVEIDAADEFVTAHRPSLEKYAQSPSKVGVLVLDVKSFPETTNLAKLIDTEGKIVCKTIDESKLAAWCVQWAKTKSDKELTKDAAELLVTYLGSEMGLLAAEIEKLATAVGTNASITPQDVNQYVTRSRAVDVFKILDHIGSQQPGDALRLMRQLLDEGEAPLAILGPLSFQLRKLASVERFMAEGLSRNDAMNAAKVPNWSVARDATVKQLNTLGRRRLTQMTQWLSDLNFGLKGGSVLPEDVQLEQLFARIAKVR